MAKYSLLVGVNKYAEPGNDLNGCVNDITGMWDRLIGKYGFQADNLRMLADQRANQQAILERLNWLVGLLKPGDVGVWHYSGHGSQVRDRDGDELDDRMDEIICPHDLNWDDPFTDDRIAEFFKKVPQGAKMIFIADCCHSGTIDRGFPGPNNPHPTKSRYLPPPVDIAYRAVGRNLPIKKIGHKGVTVATGTAAASRGLPNVTFIQQNHILLSGCRDNQTSADAYINAKYQGALTAAIMDSLDGKPANWIQLHQLVCAYLSNNGYAQVPQLSGREDLLNGPIFE